MKVGQDLDNWSFDDVQDERSIGPHARQLCHGSRRQLMVDAGKVVVCPECLLEFTDFATQRNRAQTCPVVPSHLADNAGQRKVQWASQQRGSSATPRPW